MNLQQPCFQPFAPCATLWQKLKVNVPKPKNVQIQKIINSGKMKKLTMVCMSALLLLAVSCKKDNEKLPEIEGAGFTATIELQDDGSKTHLVPGTNTSAVRWDVGDAIRVCSRDYPNGFVFTSKPESVEADGITAHFFGTNIPDAFYKSPYTAFYGDNVAVSGGTYTLNVPATQNAVYNNNAFQNNFERGTNPMAARSDSRILEFKNICGMLELKLYNTSGCHVDEIVLTAAEGVKLNGTGTVDMSSGTPVLGALNGGNTITLKCNGNLSTNANNPSHFYFVLPPVTLTGGFTITVKDGSKVDTRTVSSNINIQRSHIKPMEKLAVTTEEPPIETPEGAVEGGVFTVNSSSKKVFFAKGNLTYNKNTTKWRFYDNQTDYDPAQYNTNLISLFTYGYGSWSTSASTTTYLTGTFSDATDWGRQVAIENGGNQAGLWRTLSQDEWLYLISQRESATNGGKDKLWNLVTINGVNGAIIYPDNYKGPYYTNKNTLTAVPAKCLFLPACGYRKGTTTYTYLNNGYGQYWTGVPDRWNNNCGTIKYNEDAVTQGCQNKDWAFAVRLVQDVP